MFIFNYYIRTNFATMYKIVCFIVQAIIWLQTTYGLGLNAHTRYQISGDSSFVFNGFEDYEKVSLKRRSARESVTPTASNVHTDFHNYYNSSYFSWRPDYYTNLELDENEFTTITHKGLSSAHLRAAPVTLPFIFPFYGHNITTALIATGGFLYVGTAMHQFLTVTQYIAPLMGNFDSSINDTTSTINYGTNGTAFTVEWKNIHVNHFEQAGGFTFQTTLFDDGRIIFAYKNIPVPVDDIEGGNGHSVTVGLSDGFYIDEPLYEGSAVQTRTIYKYHEISLTRNKVIGGAAFEFFPLPTCNQLLTCSECINQGPVIHFDCAWCGAIDRCSSGLDRHRDDWVDNRCDLEAIYSDCPVHKHFPAFAIILILLVCLMIMSVIGWVVYAYRYPNSSSGMCLIEGQSLMRGKFVRDTSNENHYIVDPTKEHIPEPQVIVSNGESPTIITTTCTSSEA